MLARVLPETGFCVTCCGTDFRAVSQSRRDRDQVRMDSAAACFVSSMADKPRLTHALRNQRNCGKCAFNDGKSLARQTCGFLCFYRHARPENAQQELPDSTGVRLRSGSLGWRWPVEVHRATVLPCAG